MRLLLTLSILMLFAASSGAADLKTASDSKLEGKFQTATFSMW